VPDPKPGSGPGDGQAAASAEGQLRFAWVLGSTGTGPVPSPGLDWQALAAGGLLDGDPGVQGVVAGGEQAAAEGRMPRLAGVPMPVSRRPTGHRPGCAST
jgi:hypothetical protein